MSSSGEEELFREHGSALTEEGEMHAHVAKTKSS